MKTLLPSALLLACLCQAVSAAETDAVSWLGPLPLENERPLQAAFLHLPPQAPEVPPPGREQWSVQLDIANQLLVPATGSNGARVEEDFETQRLKVGWSRGLKQNRSWGVQGSVVGRNGGVLDSFLSEYHKLVGLPSDGKDNPAGRDAFERGRSRFFFDNGAGSRLDRGSAFGLGDTTIWVKQQVAGGPNKRFAAALRLAAKMPTGNEGDVLGSGGTDVGAFADARYALNSRFAFFGSAGAGALGASKLPGSVRSSAQGGFGLEWRLGRRDSFVAQLDAATRTVRTGNSFADRTPVIGSLGLKHQAGNRGLWWLSLSENGDYVDYKAAPLGNIGPDFTLSFGYQWLR